MRVVPGLPHVERRRAERELVALARDEVAGQYEVVVEEADDPTAAILGRAADADLMIMGIQRQEGAQLTGRSHSSRRPRQRHPVSLDQSAAAPPGKLARLGVREAMVVNKTRADQADSGGTRVLRLTSLIAAALLIVASYASTAAAQRSLAVTFDDLPANCTCNDLASWRALTDGLVRALVDNRVPAIGFVNEVKLDQDGDGTPEPQRVALLEQWLEAGLELGNHGYSHPDLHRLELADFQRDVLEGERVTRRLLAERGARPRYFRHPFLHTGRDKGTKRAFERFLEQHGYRVAPVTIDNSEWIFARAYDVALDSVEPDTAARLAVSYLGYMESKLRFYERQSRDLLGYELPQVLLLHANRLNAHALGRLAEAIRIRGYRFVSLTQALEDPAYRRRDDFTGAGGISWVQRWAIAEGRGRDYFRGEPEAPPWVLELAGIDQE